MGDWKKVMWTAVIAFATIAIANRVTFLSKILNNA